MQQGQATAPPTEPPRTEAVAERFHEAMGRMATPVNVVTSDGPAGRVGLTVSSFCLAAFDPPTMLICVNQRSPGNDIIRGNGVFRVNVLGEAHEQVSDTFAGRPLPGQEPWDFGCGRWDLEAEGGPRLEDAVVSAVCRVETVIAAGSHKVYLGRVLEAESTQASPLIYLPRNYYRLVGAAPSEDYREAEPPLDAKKATQ